MSFFIIWLAAACLGDWAARPFRVDGPERYVVRAYLGLGACALIGISVGAFSLKAAEFLLFFVAALGLVLEVIKRVRASQERQSDSTPAQHEHEQSAGFTALEWCGLAALVIANALTLLSALAPNTSWDAAVAHLALPADYAREGRIYFVEGNPYTAYPHLIHALHALAFAQSGEVAVGLLSWSFGVLACASMYLLGAQAGGRQTGILAAAIFAVSPIFFDQSGNAAIDVPFTGCAMACLACVLQWRVRGRVSLLVLAGILAGLACGMRHTGYLVVVLVAAIVFALSAERRREQTAIFAVAAAFAAYPWLLRTALLIGNPVYPFLSDLLPTPYLPDMQSTSPLAHETARGFSVASFFLFPWDVVTRPDHYDGWTRSPGGLVLILGIPGLLFGGKAVRALGAFSAAGIAVFYVFQRFARYLLPFFAPMMVAAAITANPKAPYRRGIAALLVTVFVYSLALGAAAVHHKAPAAFGLVSREEFLAKRVERYAAFEWVNRNLDPQYTVFTLDPRTYFIHAPTYQNAAILPQLAALAPEELLAWFRVRGIRYLFYSKAYMSESPAYRARGYTEIVDAWRRDDTRFRLIEVMSVPRPRTGGAERVEIYEILYGPIGVPETERESA